MAKSPYDLQAQRAFWRSAVASVSPFDLSELYRRKIEITPIDRISTAGSCFAQHIARNLIRHGYNFQDFEPPPSLLPKDQRSAFGYGLFSARFGNVYTARQLRQLIERAVGDFVPETAVWVEQGRYFDPFRPTIEPGGFDSEAELAAVRDGHFKAIRRMLQETDVFIFTFGLTEAWMSKRDGAVYPICPGVAAGRFDPAEHAFVNFSHSDVLADMLAVIKRLRAYNPQMRFLFTVSPVPLTATASHEHVLVATTYSKSVLRAVAGELANSFDHVDYFPSYEMIASPPIRGTFFEPNMRSVNSAGVDFVMSHFFQQYASSPQPDEASATGEELEADDGVCDEELLDIHRYAEGNSI